MASMTTTPIDNSEGAQVSVETLLTDNGSNFVSVAKKFSAIVALGLVTGVSAIFKFGRASTLASGSHVVWNSGGAYAFQTTAQALEVVSSSTDDVMTTGSGAWSVKIFGLDADYAEQSEVVELNGTTPVALVNDYLRVFRMRVQTTGDADPITGPNTGTLTCRLASAGASQAIISPTQGTTLMAVYTVPAGYTALLHNFQATVDGAKEVSVTLRTRGNSATDTAGTSWQTKFTADLQGGGTDHNFEFPQPFTEKTDIIAVAVASSGTPSVSANFTLELVANPA